MTNEEQVQHLQDLIAVAKDGELGYRNAAAHVSEPHLATIFEKYATERAGFVRDLQAEVARLAGAPGNGAPGTRDERRDENGDASGTLTGSIFRGWIDVKSAVTGGGPAALVAACETGDDSAQAAYERVVNSDISGQTRALVESQWHKIQEAHQRMLHLKAEL